MGSLKERLEEKRKKKIKSEKASNNTGSKRVEKDAMLKGKEERNGNNKPTDKKKRKRYKRNNVDTGNSVEISTAKLGKAEAEKKRNKPRKKGRKNDPKIDDLVSKHDHLGTEMEVDKLPSLFKTQGGVDNSREQNEAVFGTEIRNRKSKKSKKRKNKEQDAPKKDENILGKREGKERTPDQDDAYCISSGDEDCSKGMKKWLTEYHQSRPGLKVLQQRIDEFITAHEEKLEKERKEREALAAEDGWTVVVHHKGRKKTTDSESGVTVGSVAPVVVKEQMATKKSKQVGLEFYRFQKREAQRNEILMLQTKFEQDKKRIQQLRAARKFRPY